MSDLNPKESEPIALVAEAAGALFEHWGYRPVVGRVWAALILCPDVKDAPSLLEMLGISTGALSMALKELVELGLVYRETKEGRRRFFYRAETDLLVIATHIFRKRERVKLVAVLDKLRSAEVILDKETPEQESDSEASYRLEQVRRLLGLGEFIIGALDAVMERTKVELKAAQKWLSVSGKLGGEPLSRIRRAINASRMRKKNN